MANRKDCRKQHAPHRSSMRMAKPGCASTWSPAFLGSIFAPTGKSRAFPRCHTQRDGERRGKRMCFSRYGYKREACASPPPAPESAALRGALTPACILINIIPPSINSKSTYFTPGEKNNPRLVSPASPGAAEGLNPPHPYFTTSFSLGDADRVRCSSMPWKWL